jgi:hypothetical protein
MSGEGVKASSRHPEKSPKELKAQEGTECLADLNHLSSQRIAARIKALKTKRVDLALVGQLTRRRISLMP